LPDGGGDSVRRAEVTQAARPAAALQIPVEMIHYGMTKTAQLAISRGLAETTAGTAVTVNAVLPGPTASEGVNEFVSGLARTKRVDRGSVERQFFSEARPTSIIQRFATPEEIAALVAFVCSPLASAINGAALRVDGGVVRSIAWARAAKRAVRPAACRPLVPPTIAECKLSS